MRHFSMKNSMLALVLGLILGTSGAALAADIANLSGQSCGAGTCGTWHFVNNQTGGAAAGTLNANFSEGADCSTGPSQVNQNVQHFICSGCGELLAASTTGLGGRLVLSDFDCEKKEECVPVGKEICGNLIDEDCDGTAQTCPK